MPHDRYPQPQNDEPDMAAEAMAQAARRVPELADWLFSDEEVQGCEEWRVTESSFVSETLPASQVPTLALAGRHDPTTPAGGSEMVSDALANSHYLLFQDGSHDVSGSRCARTLMQLFLNDPGKRPVHGCYDNQRELVLRSRSTR